MPRRSEAKTTGLWEREPGSGVWWIRYRSNGVLKREKVGRKGDALALYQKRKTELRAGMKLPENFRTATVRFRVIAEEIRNFSKKHHRDQRNLESRLKKTLQTSATAPSTRSSHPTSMTGSRTTRRLPRLRTATVLSSRSSSAKRYATDELLTILRAL
jgi:hypothetical protein